MDVDIVDSEGRSAARGWPGELVCRGTMAVDDPRPAGRRPGASGDSYWRRWPGMWAHGDWASRDADGAWFVHGRSEERLNLAGKRTGPAEIETVLLGHPQVAEAAAFGVPDQAKGEALWCAVVPAAAGRDRDGGELAGELRQLVASRLGGRVPPGPGPDRARPAPDEVGEGHARPAAQPRGRARRGGRLGDGRAGPGGRLGALLSGSAAAPATERPSGQTGSDPSDRT